VRERRQEGERRKERKKRRKEKIEKKKKYGYFLNLKISEK
jgi:hypothetical protein